MCHLNNGHVNVSINMISVRDPTITMVTNERVNDGTWHELVVKRVEALVTIKVDSNTYSLTYKAPGNCIFSVYGFWLLILIRVPLTLCGPGPYKCFFRVHPVTWEFTYNIRNSRKTYEIYYFWRFLSILKHCHIFSSRKLNGVPNLFLELYCIGLLFWVLHLVRTRIGITLLV